MSLQRWSAQWVVVWLLHNVKYTDTMIRILVSETSNSKAFFTFLYFQLFSLLISMALGLPYLGSPSGAAAYPAAAPAWPHHHHVVKR